MCYWGALLTWLRDNARLLVTWAINLLWDKRGIRDFCVWHTGFFSNPLYSKTGQDHRYTSRYSWYSRHRCSRHRGLTALKSIQSGDLWIHFLNMNQYCLITEEFAYEKKKIINLILIYQNIWKLYNSDKSIILLIDYIIVWHTIQCFIETLGDMEL